MEMTARREVLCSLFLTKHHSSDNILKNEMDRTCGMYGKEETCIQGSWGNLMEKKRLEDLAADGRTIMDLEKVVWGGMDWINLAYDRYR